MTPTAFRRIALGQPGAFEGAHMGHADFRLNGRIFATLGSPDAGHGMVQVTREEQEMLMAAEPAIFTPAKGAWGLKGSTLVRLDAADEATVMSAMAIAAARLAAEPKGKGPAFPPALPRSRLKTSDDLRGA